MLPPVSWPAVALFLTAIAAVFDLRYRKIPIALVGLGLGLLVLHGILALRVSYDLEVGLLWFGVCAALAYFASLKKEPFLAEGDLLWYGVIGGMVANPYLIVLLVLASLLFRVCLSTFGIWRRSMPFLVAMVFACALVLLVVSA